jgi:hypothetical protein
MFRVSHHGEGIDDADSLEGAREIVRAALRPGPTTRLQGMDRLGSSRVSSTRS